jgi:HK97 family phage major capsid protein
MDLKKIQDEIAQTMAEARKQIEKKNAGQGSFNAEAFEAKFMKALADRDAIHAAEKRKAPFIMEEEPTKPQPRVLLEKSERPEVKEFQKFNDDCVMLASLTRKHPTTLEYFQKNKDRFLDERGSTEVAKAMAAATGGSGADWVPTEFSSDLYDRVRLDAVIAGQFAEIQMPTPIYKLPTGDTDPTTYLTPENTSDTPNLYPASTPSTGNVTLTASKLTTNMVFSDEITEDSIIPILEYLKNRLAKSMMYTLEDAYLNGDNSTTHMDADVTVSTDARKVWKGLRKLALVSKDTSFSSWAPAVVATGIGLLRSMRSKMGRYGTLPSKLAYMVGVRGLIALLSMPEIMTLEKYGPQATILTGEIGKVDNISVLVSEKFREDLNASGFNDSTTNVRAAILLAHLPAFVRGTRRGLRVRPWVDPRSGTQNLVQDWRGDFQPVFATGQPYVVKGVDWGI